MSREYRPRHALVVPVAGYQDTAGVVKAFEGSLNFRTQIDFTAKRQVRRQPISNPSRDPSGLLTRQRMPATPQYEQLDIKDIVRDRITRVYRKDSYTDSELQSWAYNLFGQDYVNQPRRVIVPALLEELDRLGIR